MPAANARNKDALHELENADITFKYGALRTYDH